MKNGGDKIKITPAKGRPMLHWVGKKPLDYVKGFPAQLVEVFDPLNNGQVIETPPYNELKDNWQNLLFHGDNKDVLATLLESGFRGKIDLIYIDPPFMSGADYVRKIELRGLKQLGRIEEDEASILQQTMYFDIWNNDNYLQFMYERLILLKELLSERGSIYVHLDWHVGHYIKLLMDEVFGQDNFGNEIVWHYRTGNIAEKIFRRSHDTILLYSKSDNFTFKPVEIKEYYKEIYGENFKPSFRGRKQGEDGKGKYRLSLVDDVWDISGVFTLGKEHLAFATQKPEALLERIIQASSNSNSLILDCFIGSGTTARVAQKTGRRWIGCDINKGAIQTTSKRLQKIILEQMSLRGGEAAEAISKGIATLPTVARNDRRHYSFAVYKVNDYDLQLLKTEAIELAVQHIGIQRVRTDAFFDGHLGKSLVKIIDFNHPLTLLDLQLLQDELKKRPDEARDITIVCLGKELAVDPEIEKWNKTHPVNKIKVIELKTDKNTVTS
jgi:DNA modification methylase